MPRLKLTMNYGDSTTHLSDYIVVCKYCKGVFNIAAKEVTYRKEHGLPQRTSHLACARANNDETTLIHSDGFLK